MTSWKLVGAAMKAQRTWANLSPEQKEQVRRTASQAAKNAYARMQETPATPASDETPQATVQPAPPEAEPSAPRPSAPSAAESLVGLARQHGPRLARQAAVTAATRSQNRAGQLLSLWRRAQQARSK